MFNFHTVLFLSLTSGFLYLGPESIMPIASVIAAIIGVILIFWRYIISVIKKGYKYLYRKITGKPITEPVNLDLDNDEDDLPQDIPTGPKA